MKAPADDRFVARFRRGIKKIEGESLRELTLVRIIEFHSSNWAVGGPPLSTSDVKAKQRAAA